MSRRAIYLALHAGSSNTRTHFALFIPNEDSSNCNLSEDFKAKSAKRTVIQVVGEPLMQGYVLKFKRNEDCCQSMNLKRLVPLGYIEDIHLSELPSDAFALEYTPRGTI